MVGMRAVAMFACLTACGSNDPPPVDAACQPAILYLDRNGGSYDHGPVDDSTTNSSVLLDGPRTLPPYPQDDIDWGNTTRCIRDSLAPFPIQVTEIDPGLVPHVEIVFTTSYWAGPAGTTMIVPDGCRPGHQVEFVFGDALATDVRACQMAMIGFAQMTANLSIGDNCHDLLDLSMDCAPTRSFEDTTVNCVDATDAPIPCRCGGTTQNTFQTLAAAFPACS
jgi:hypothetical protein